MKTAAAPRLLKHLLLGLLGLALSLPAVLEARSSVAPERALADANRLLTRFSEWSLYRGTGDSMAPRFDANHLLFVKSVSGADLRPGMIALFHDAEGDLVAHTVLDNDGQTVATRGLNNAAADPLRIEHTAVVGVLIGTLAANAPFSADLDLPVALGKTY